MTQEQWGALVPENPSNFQACGPDCPVELVSWFEAVTFANHLSDREGLDRCYELVECGGLLGDWGIDEYTCNEVRFVGLDCPGYRLPTDAEWEVAARAGTKTALYTGGLNLRGKRDAPQLDPIAWYGGKSGVEHNGGVDCSDWKEKQYASRLCGTHPVGQKLENPWGLYDMLGNVWEWTGDTWQAEIPATLAVDPLGLAQGSNRGIRGGSWSSLARVVRASCRFRAVSFYRDSDLGFRLARSGSSSYPKPEAE